jgi:hypothetical protein
MWGFSGTRLSKLTEAGEQQAANGFAAKCGYGFDLAPHIVWNVPEQVVHRRDRNSGAI